MNQTILPQHLILLLLVKFCTLRRQGPTQMQILHDVCCRSMSAYYVRLWSIFAKIGENTLQ